MDSRVVFITGGTLGIGLALADACLARGDRVAVCGRTKEHVDQFTRLHPDALAIEADLTHRDALKLCLERIQENFGRLDILINNAGVFHERTFASGNDKSSPHWSTSLDEEIEVNLRVPIQLTGMALDMFASSLKSIVFLTSGFAFAFPARAPTYAAAKAGLHAFSEALRWQLRAKNQAVDVLEVAAPTIDTRMNDTIVDRKKMSPNELAKQTLDALDRKAHILYPGDSFWIPILLRLAPGYLKRVVSTM